MAVTAYDLCIQVAIEPDEYDEDETISTVIDRCLKSATLSLLGSVGYHPSLLDDPRAETFLLEQAADMYEGRLATDVRTTRKLYTALNRHAQDLLTQLRCDYGYPAFLGYETVVQPDDVETYEDWLKAYIKRVVPAREGDGDDRD